MPTPLVENYDLIVTLYILLLENSSASSVCRDENNKTIEIVE